MLPPTRLQPWQLLRSETVFDHPWYTLRRDWAALPDGRTVDDYFVSVRAEVVLVFPLTTEGEVVLVRQYKHGAQRILTELPGGTFDPARETAEVAARRELREETGYAAPEMERLGTWHDNPTKDTNTIHAFLARGVYPAGAQDLDPTEDIEVLHVRPEGLRKLIVEGEIHVAGTVALGLLGLAALGR